MRIIFVRHGEPDYEKDCLTPTGKLQAEAAARRLAREGIVEIYASPMGRASETAACTAELLNLPVHTLDFMHEINWGEARPDKVGTPDEVPYRGHPWTLGYKLLTEYPGYVGSEEWDRHPFFKDNLCMDYYRMISEDGEAPEIVVCDYIAGMTDQYSRHIFSDLYIPASWSKL